jgi:hypothetical protein
MPSVPPLAALEPVVLEAPEPEVPWADDEPEDPVEPAAGGIELPEPPGVVVDAGDEGEAGDEGDVWP